MTRINICSILLNDSDDQRQIISYDTEDKHLYTDAEEEPIDTPELETINDAENFCYYTWFRTYGWDAIWIERDD